MRQLRQAWHRLISMKTALVLLFLLMLASVPGSLLPQRPLNPSKVNAYLATHGSYGRFLDSIGAFDVFGSVWFSAVYLLLFISLIGCISQRVIAYVRALRAKPIKAPRHLGRLAENTRFTTGLTPDEAAAAAKKALRPRWRVIVRHEEDRNAVAVSAEKGYSREAGNLLFHTSLMVSLVLIAIGRFFHYEGSIVLTEGKGFCNVAGFYDNFRAGRAVDSGTLKKFCVDNLNSFTAEYRADGSPASFKADITYSNGFDGAPKHTVVRVNHPLRFDGDRVYLIAHGYSPTVTLHRKDGTTVTDTAPFLPQDGNLTSEGVFKFASHETGDVKKNDVGIEGLFAPTPVDTGGGVITSNSPVLNNPVLAIFAYTGDLGLNNGIPQNVYTLDSKQKSTGKLTKVAAKNMKVGDSLPLQNGDVITFDGYKQWASFQVSHDPTQGMLLISAVLMVGGLLGSLVVRRRRVWLRMRVDGSGSHTLVEVGGLARSDTGVFGDEFAELAERLREALKATPDGDLPQGTPAHGGHEEHDEPAPARAGRD